MSVITEAALRVLLKDEDLDALKEYCVDSGVIVTPSARAYLTDHKIDLIIGDKRVIRNPAGGEEKASPAAPNAAPAVEENGALPAFSKPVCYESLYGGCFDEKPEHMTALHGKILVYKNHKRIRLRGRLDSLQAAIISAQILFCRLGLEKGAADLETVLTFTKEMMRSEVLDEPLRPVQLLGMDEAQIREHSHHPKKYYDMPHFAASVDDGEAVAALNALRCLVREVEIAALEAFEQPGEPEHMDILRGLNRLSSVFYVMMFKAKAKEYAP